MKNRFNSFSLFSLFVLLYSHEFFRMVLATNNASLSLTKQDSLISNEQRINTLNFLMAQTVEQLGFHIPQHANSKNIDPNDLPKAIHDYQISNTDLLEGFLKVLEAEDHDWIEAMLKQNPNLVHSVIDQGPIHKKRPALPHIEKLRDGRILTRALELGADANNQGNTVPLRHAVMAKMWKYAEILFLHGATANIFVAPNMPLIKYLCTHDQTDLATKIVASDQFLDHAHLPPTIVEAINKKQNNVLEALFNRAPILENTIITIRNEANSEIVKYLPAHFAVATNNTNLLKIMKKQKLDLTCVTRPFDARSLSPLAIAVMFKHTETFDALIALGVEPALDKSSPLPIFYAAFANDTIILEKLLAKGCNPNSMAYAHGGLLLDSRALTPEIRDLLVQYGGRQSTLFDVFYFALSENLTSVLSCSAALLIICILLAADPFHLKKQAAKLCNRILFPHQKRNQIVVELIQSIFSELFSTSVSISVKANKFTLILPTEDLSIKEPNSGIICKITGKDGLSILERRFNKLNSHDLTVKFNPPNLTLQLNTPKAIESLKLEKLQIVAEIKSDLVTLCYQTRQYGNYLEDTQREEAESQRKKMITNTREQLRQTLATLSILPAHLHSLQATSSAMQTDLTKLLQKQSDLDWNSKRLQKPLELLQREIDKFNPSSCMQARMIVSNALLELNQLEESITEDSTTTELNKNIQAIAIVKNFVQQQQSFTPTQYRNSLDYALMQLTEGIARYNQDNAKSAPANSVAQAKEFKRSQFELEAQRRREEALRVQQENEEKKQKFRLHQEEQRRIEAERCKAEAERQERIRIAKLKREEALREEQARRAQSSSSSRIQLNPLLKAKVTTIGDLLQRSENLDESIEPLRIQYHYALLAQCLRLFEITDQFLKSKVTQNIRNTLMHQHRYFDLSALRELANLIAHRPTNQNDTSHEKFEDIINALQENVEPELIEKLRVSLMHLSLSNFHSSYVQKELEKHSTRQYLQIIQHGLQDLAKLNTKLEQGLSAHPDKILAIQGILMCVGEAYQQLIHQQEHLVLANHERTDLSNFMRIAKDTRDRMAHTVEEPVQNEGLYLKLLNQSLGHAEALDDLLEQQQAEKSASSTSMRI